jgi:hypothetical protein
MKKECGGFAVEKPTCVGKVVFLLLRAGLRLLEVLVLDLD